MAAKEFRDLVESLGQAELLGAVSCARDDLEFAFDAGILECLVESLALDQRHDVVLIAVNGEKRGALAVHMMKRAGAAGFFQIL